MQNITSLQIAAVIIVSIIGFAFRLGLEYYNKKEVLPGGTKIFFMFIFSIGAAFLMFLYTLDKDIKLSINLILIWAASFFGSVVIVGLGSIKSEFFAEFFKDFIRKWANNKVNGESTTPLTDGETENYEEMPKDVGSDTGSNE